MTNISDGTINILRGISDTNVKPQERDWKYDTSIWNAASEQADKEDNKTAITVLLEDFAELILPCFQGILGRNCHAVVCIFFKAFSSFRFP